MTTSNRTMDEAERKPEEEAESPVTMMTQAEYNEKMESHQAIVQAKSAEQTQLTEMLKSVRENKVPLTQVKNSLQEEINTCNKTINAVSEEVTHLKQKLRYHSVKQIHDNIERLEYQLRNNNFKPREEQKILDEISMLQRSVRTLRQYEDKQAENKKFRTERARLIEERNNNYSKIRALYVKEDEIKKEIAAARGEILASRKSIDQLRHMKPKLEQEWLAQHQKQQALRNKRYEEKKRLRQEQLRDRQEERRKLWEEYEASRELYEEEKNYCRVLISYLHSKVGAATPCTPASTGSLPSESNTPATTPSLQAGAPSLASTAGAANTPATAKDTSMLPPESSGAYYSKTKGDDDGFTRVNKRGKAKAKREQRLANRVKELPHTPDVLLKFSKLSISPPKNTDQVPAAIVSLQDRLQHFYSLSLSESNSNQTDTNSESDRKVKGVGRCSRPKSLPVMPCSDPATNTQDSATGGKESSPSPSPSASVQHLTNPSSIPAINVVSPSVSWVSGVSNHVPGNKLSSNISVPSTHKTQAVYNGVPPQMNGMSSVSELVASEALPDLQMCADILSSGNNESFFSMPISYPSNLVEAKTIVEPNNNGGFSYAAVTAKVKLGSLDY